MPATAPRKPRPRFVENEEITLEDAAEWIGPRRAGRPTHVSTVRQWAAKGLHGVRLRCEPRGGMKVTTVQWLREFWRAAAAAKERQKERVQAEAAAARSPARRQRDHENAMRNLEAAGVLKQRDQ